MFGSITPGIPGIVLLAALGPLYSVANADVGKILGEREYALPAWFKQSFLEIREDVAEANEANRQVMLFMHVDRCPYCTRLLDENFREGENKRLVQSRFDVIAIDIKGSRQIQWNAEKSFAENDFARALEVVYTPTIVFLDADGKQVYRMHGYRVPSAFRYVLDYVAGEHYRRETLPAYIARTGKSGYEFRSHPSFAPMDDFSSYRQPLLVLFEDRYCGECDEFHEKVLQREDVGAELANLRVVRLDAYSNREIIGPDGRATTPRAWADELGLDYRPGAVLFDRGREITRTDGRLYHFHFREIVRYVAKRFHDRYPTFIDYLRVREPELLDAGIDIDFGN